MPYSHSAANPLMWLYAAVYLLPPLGVLASPALLTLSIPLLVTGRRTFPGQTAGIRRWLLVAAVTALVVPMIAFSALGRDVGTWLAD